MFNFSILYCKCDVHLKTAKLIETKIDCVCGKVFLPTSYTHHCVIE